MEHSFRRMKLCLVDLVTIQWLSSTATWLGPTFLPPSYLLESLLDFLLSTVLLAEIVVVPSKEGVFARKWQHWALVH